jgi:beta-1,4-mannosyl-glycoprotein beta-1,4-N-acetylglucosaminyltransferase
MKNKIYELLFITDIENVPSDRLQLNYNKVDQIFIFGERNTFNFRDVDPDKKCFFIPFFNSEITVFYESGFSMFSSFVTLYHTDIFVISSINEFAPIDTMLYQRHLKSFPIVHRMNKEDGSKHMGTFAFQLTHNLKNKNLISDIVNKRDSINVIELNFINSGFLSEQKNNHSPLIFDCFIFNDEFSLLENRLKLLKDVVHKFVLVESKQTHSGQFKDSHFEKNKTNYSEYLDKIIHVVVEKFPEKMLYQPSEIDVDPELHIHWFRENFQRNEILKGLYSADLKDTDFVLISDVDEIPDPRTLKKFLDQIPEGDFGFQLQKWCIWDFDRYHGGFWPGTAGVRWKDLKKTTPQEIRKNRYSIDKFHTNERYGWHCSWFGGINTVMNKLSSFAHQELRDLTREEVQNKMTMNLDIHGHQLLTEDDGFNPPIL